MTKSESELKGKLDEIIKVRNELMPGICHYATMAKEKGFPALEFDMQVDDSGICVKAYDLVRDKALGFHLSRAAVLDGVYLETFAPHMSRLFHEMTRSNDQA